LIHGPTTPQSINQRHPAWQREGGHGAAGLDIPEMIGGLINPWPEDLSGNLRRVS